MHTVVAENFLVALPSLPAATARAIDLWYWVIFTALWCLLHLAICAGARLGWFHRRWEDVVKEDDQDSQWTYGSWAGP